MNVIERAQWRAFEGSGLGELWQWLVGGMPPHLATGLTTDVIADFFALMVETVEQGASDEDLLKLREYLRWRLMQEEAGRRKRGPS